MKIEVSKAEFKAIEDAADTMEAMIGCGEDERSWIKTVKKLHQIIKREKKNMVKSKK